MCKRTPLYYTHPIIHNTKGGSSRCKESVLSLPCIKYVSNNNKILPEEAAYREAVICVSADSVSKHTLTLGYSKLCVLLPWQPSHVKSHSGRILLRITFRDYTRSGQWQKSIVWGGESNTLELRVGIMGYRKEWIHTFVPNEQHSEDWKAAIKVITLVLISALVCVTSWEPLQKVFLH